MRSLLTILMAFAIASTASAEELRGPDVVLVGETFTAFWSGENNNGDQVTIAQPDSAASDSVTTARTNGAGVASVTAPLEVGTYELRFLRGTSMMASRPIEVIRPPTVSTSTGGSGSGSGVPAPIDDEHTYSEVLLLKGYQLGSEREGEIMQSRRQACRDWATVGPALSTVGNLTEDAYRQTMANADPQLATLLTRVEGALQMQGIDIFNDFQDHLGTAEAALCDDITSDYFNHFTITYAYCRMTMDTPTQSLDIHMPPSSAAALMQAIDFAEESGMQIDLARDMQGTIVATGAGFADTISMSATSGTDSMLGHDVYEYSYQYAARMGGTGAAPGMEMIAGMVSVDNVGTAWVAPTVEGDSIPRRFYWNLATQVQPADGMSGYFSGMIMNLAGMLQHGLPLDVSSTVTSKMAGRTVMSADSRSVITDVSLVPMPSGWCERDIVPPHFEVTNVSAQLDQLSAQQGGSANAPSAAQMSAAQQELERAMADLTPEQRAAVEQAMGGNLPQQSMPTQASANQTELQAAQQACLEAAVAKAEAEKKEKKFGRMLGAIRETVMRTGNVQLADAVNDVYSGTATAKDIKRLAKDLGISKKEVKACQNPGS